MTTELTGASSLRGKADIGSPEWWLRRLHAGIIYRHPTLNRLQSYYDGEFSLRYADEKLRQAFGNVFYAERFGLNWCRVVIGAVEERLLVESIRVGGSQDNDPAAWKLWQAANLDETSSIAHVESLINGVAYVTVWPSEDADNPVDITIEHPAQAIVEVNPKRPRERLAGLRMYVDSFGYLHAELFLPDAVYTYRSDAARDTTWTPETMVWIYDTVPEQNEGRIRNPYGVVPMVPFQNLPRLALNTATLSRDVAKRSELWPVMPVQDAINSTLFNMMLTANAQGFRQRWVTGLEIETDEAGKPKQPFKSGIDRLFMAESPEVKFGEFSAADVSQFVGALDMLVHALGSIAQVPPHYFSASADRLSGESIKAAESGLVAKVKRRQVTFGGAWEEVMRLAGLMTGNEALAKAHACEVVWSNPEVRSDVQIADAAVKLDQIGLPWRGLMEFLGYSPQAIVALEKWRKEDAATAVPAIVTPPFMQPTTPGQPAPTNGPVPTPAPAGAAG